MLMGIEGGKDSNRTLMSVTLDITEVSLKFVS